MLKLFVPAAGAALALLAAAPAQAALGPDAAACRPGSRGPAFLVAVSGFKNRAGTLRVQLYGSNPADFLAMGKKLKRIDLPVTAGVMRVCVAAPGPGRYAIAVRHDADSNGKSDWSDGGGFSRNPHLSLLSLKPSYQDVALDIRGGVRPVPIVLNYRHGLSIGPVAGAGNGVLDGSGIE
jgi:uncharacterized protein (DUF2141 family)